MNIENMKKLRDYIAGLDPRLVRMHEYVGKEIRLNGHCGTTACIAGHCWLMERGALLPDFDERYLRDETIAEWAGEFLGLQDHEAEDLFNDMPREFQDPPENPQTPRKREKEWVLRRLDRCIKLGTVP